MSDQRPFSIDLSLELERQLDSDSTPPTPAEPRPHSLDPHVLAHIVADLTAKLADTTRARDDLVAALTALDGKCAALTDKCTALQTQLDTAETKAQDDAHTIALLRTKVEESRRGLMRLQSERRASQVPAGLDLARAGSTTASKRASFAPLAPLTAGSYAHRRISSVSDSGLPSPASISFPDPALRFGAPRSPGLFGRVSPPPPEASVDSGEVEALQRELAGVRRELDEARHELSEATEAREASELCVKALRVFIEEHNVGPTVGSTTAVPSPSDAKRAPPAQGWGFKLWRTEPLPKPPPTNPDPTTSLACATVPVVPLSASPPPQPLTRKLGDFFGTRRTSVSSTAPIKSPHRLSDASSVDESLAEPASPTSEVPHPVRVRDTMSVTSGSSRDVGSPVVKMDGLAGELTSVAI